MNSKRFKYKNITLILDEVCNYGKMNLERYRQYRKMSLDLTKSQIDSQLSNADIYPEATKLSIAKVLLEWNQNNNVRKSASNVFNFFALT